MFGDENPTSNIKFPLSRKAFREFLDNHPRIRRNNSRCILERALDEMPNAKFKDEYGYVTHRFTVGTETFTQHDESGDSIDGKLPAWAQKVVAQYDDGVSLRKLKF